MQMCWQLDPDRRPSSYELCKEFISKQSDECLLDSPGSEQVKHYPTSLTSGAESLHRMQSSFHHQKALHPKGQTSINKYM